MTAAYFRNYIYTLEKNHIDSSIYSNNVKLHLIKTTHLLTQGYIRLKVFRTNKLIAIMQDHAIDCA
jgi:hypothetical protein